jgi:hypothetical protein
MQKLSWNIILVLVISTVSVSHAAVIFQNLGTSAPPGSLGSHTIAAFNIGSQAAIPEFTNVSTIPGSPISGNLTTSLQVMKLTIPSSWTTWSHGYTGPCFWSNGATLILTLPPGTGAFYFYAEPVGAVTANYTFVATTNTGTTSGDISVYSDSGATGFGFYATVPGETISTITVTCSDPDGFALAEFGAGSNPTPSAIVFKNLGTAAPPPTLGVFSLASFNLAPQAAIADFTNVTTIPGSPFCGDLTTSLPVMKLVIPAAWATWSHGYTGPCFWSNGTTLILTLPPGTGAFYFYAEPVGAITANYTFVATTNTGTTSGDISVYSDSGATGFGFYATVPGETISTITVTCSDPDGFALAEFGAAQVFSPPVIYVGQDAECNSQVPCVTSVQSGIGSVQCSAILDITQETYTENVILDTPKEITLWGGWDTNFTYNSSYTTINGFINIIKGRMILENIILR